jgi:ATP-binding cassette subfamily B protein
MARFTASPRTMSSPSPPPGPSNWTLIRRLLGLAWRYRWACLRLLAYQAAVLALTITALRLVGFGIDLIRYHAEGKIADPLLPWGAHLPAWPAMQRIGLVALLILVTELIRAALNSHYIRTAGRLIHAGIVVDLRSLVYQKLQLLSFRFFDANATGTIINRVTGDVQAVRAFIDGVLIQLVILVISLVCYLSYMASIHAGLTLACLATTPILWVLTATFSRIVRPLYDKNRENVDQIILRLAENVQGIHVVKGFGREREEIAKFTQGNDLVRDQQQGIFWTVSLFTPIIGFCTQINIVILLAYGGYLVAQHELPLGGGLVVFAGLLQQFSSQVANMTNLTNSIQQSLSGARRVFEILDAPAEVVSAPDAVRLPRANGGVAFEHVTFGYDPALPVLKDLSFKVEPGECVAILGSTGSGKSTLLALLCRFYDPTSGRVLIDGLDARDIDLADLRRNIGLVFQETFLFSNTVAANIAFGHPDATQKQIERAARIAAAHEFIVNLPKGYDTVLGEAGLDLSGGQRQRLAIARAVLLDPAILILDDPAASVDPHTEEEILAAMDAAMTGRTTFIVAHRLSTLRRADKVIVLDKGQIVQAGTHQELFQTEGHFREAALIQLQAAENTKGESISPIVAVPPVGLPAMDEVQSEAQP